MVALDLYPPHITKALTVGVVVKAIVGLTYVVFQWLRERSAHGAVRPKAHAGTD